MGAIADAEHVGHYADFMCICDEKSKAEAEACYERVLRDLAPKGKERCDPGDLLSAIVYGLQWALPNRYVGDIEGIACDQWAAVSAEVMRINPETKKYETTAVIYVQCDRVEHGIARVWELANEAAGGS